MAQILKSSKRLDAQSVQRTTFHQCSHFQRGCKHNPRQPDNRTSGAGMPTTEQPAASVLVPGDSGVTKLFGSLDNVQCTAAFVMRMEVSTGVIEGKNKTKNQVAECCQLFSSSFFHVAISPVSSSSPQQSETVVQMS